MSVHYKKKYKVWLIQTVSLLKFSINKNHLYVHTYILYVPICNFLNLKNFKVSIFIITLLYHAVKRLKKYTNRILKDGLEIFNGSEFFPAVDYFIQKFA